MSDIERYLRRATRGTWGRKRAEIREELAAHIDERVQVHRIGGLDENSAVEKALAELGEAGQVSAGMMRLHSMPTLLGSSFLVSVAVAFTLLALPPSTAQTLEASAFFPSPECLESRETNPHQQSDFCFQMGETLWTNLEGLTAALEPSGVNVEKAIYGAKLTFPNSETVNLPLFGLPNFGPSTVTVGDISSFSAAEGYFDFWSFVESFSIASDLSVQLSSLENPELTLGNATVAIDTTAFYRGGTAFDFYKSYLYSVLEEEFFTTSYIELLAPRVNPLAESSEKITLRLNTEPGDIYALVVKLDPEDARLDVNKEYGFDFVPAAFLVDIVEAQSDVLEFYSAGEPRFVNPPPLGNSAASGEAILVKLNGGTNGNWYEVVPPEDITLN